MPFQPMTPTQQVNLAIGNTDEAFLNDGQVSYYLGLAGGSVPLASALAADAVLAQLAMKCAKSVGDLSIAYQQQFEHYEKLADRLWGAVGGRGAAAVGQFLPYCGGISQADKAANDANPDLVRGAFKRNMHETDTESWT